MSWSVIMWVVLKIPGFYLLTLREDEQGRLQSRLEGWWIRIDDTRSRALSWSGAFLKGTAQSMREVLELIFGERLLSMRFLVTSFWLSWSSLLLFNSILGGDGGLHLRTPFPNWDFARSCMVLFVAIAPAISATRMARIISYCGFCWVVAQFLYREVVVTIGGRGRLATGMLIAVTLLLGVSYLLDVVYVYVVRWLLKIISKGESNSEVFRAALGIFVPIALILLLLLFPLGVGLKVMTAMSSPTLGVFGLVIMLSVILNCLNLLLSVAMLLFAIVLLFHRLIWPLVQRPLYTLQKEQFVRKKKALWAIGGALLFSPNPATCVALLKAAAARLAAL